MAYLQLLLLDARYTLPDARAETAALELHR
jgi:hypothetical protein